MIENQKDTYHNIHKTFFCDNQYECYPIMLLSVHLASSVKHQASSIKRY